jgi:hypothetical protein
LSSLANNICSRIAHAVISGVKRISFFCSILPRA